MKWKWNRNLLNLYLKHYEDHVVSVVWFFYCTVFSYKWPEYLSNPRVPSSIFPTGLVMSAITVIILVLYFVINTFVVEGLYTVSPANTLPSPVCFFMLPSTQASRFTPRCVCCRSHVVDGVYSGLHSVLCQILHHWSHRVGRGRPRRLTSRCHHLSGLLREGKQAHLVRWEVDREVVLQPSHSVNNDHVGQRGADWAGFYFYIFYLKPESIG